MRANSGLLNNPPSNARSETTTKRFIRDSSSSSFSKSPAAADDTSSQLRSSMAGGHPPRFAQVSDPQTFPARHETRIQPWSCGRLERQNGTVCTPPPVCVLNSYATPIRQGDCGETVLTTLRNQPPSGAARTLPPIGAVVSLRSTWAQAAQIAVICVRPPQWQHD
jgi:hypothetical protein